MATIVRGSTTLTPRLVLGWTLAREGRSVTHPILGTAETEVTTRAPGPRSGELRTLWATEAAARTAQATLAVPGGPWTWDLGYPFVAYVIGDVTIEPADDAGTRWILTAGVQEAT